MKMTRQELDDHLVDYLYNELPAGDARRFEEGLVDHADLQAEVAAHQRTSSMFGSLEPEPMPAGLLDGVMREARLSAVPAGAARPGFFAWLLELMMQPAMATAMLFFIVAGTGWFLVRGDAMDSASRSTGKVSAAPEATVAGDELARADQPADAPAAGGPPAAPSVARADEAMKEMGNGAKAKLLEVEAKGTAPSDLSVADASPREQPARKLNATPALDSKPAGGGAFDVAVAPKTEAKRSFAKRLRPKTRSAGRAAPEQVAGVERDGLRETTQTWYGDAEGAGQAAAAPSAPTTGATAASARPTPAAGARQQADVARSYEEEARARASASKAAQSARAESKTADADRASDDSKARADAEKDAEEADGRRRAAAKATVLLKRYEGYVRKGDVNKARTVLDELAKVPGYEAEAKKKRVALEAERTNRTGTAAEKRARKKARKKSVDTATEEADEGYTGKPAPAKKATTAF